MLNKPDRVLQENNNRTAAGFFFNETTTKFFFCLSDITLCLSTLGETIANLAGLDLEVCTLLELFCIHLSLVMFACDPNGFRCL
jgi:hypothetical protein